MSVSEMEKGRRSRARAMTGARLSWLVFCVLVFVGAHVSLPFGYWWIWLPAGIGVALLVWTGRTARAQHAVRPPAVEVDPPVRGRWQAVNSPADKVPSHGTYGYGQAYAIDIVAEPGPESGTLSPDAGPPGTAGPASTTPPPSRPAFAWLWPVARRNVDFPAFGAPLLAVADATVVHASDGQRDHLSRNSLAGLVYLMLFESVVRDIAGARRMFGNHLILDLGNGTYAAYAHLRQGSLEVGAGDRVSAGQTLARCGNSGNSSEPHLHFQLMDHPDLNAARGIPFRWRGIGVPSNSENFVNQI
ncbi:murein hydrolase activator EnvC family protein [Streptomyces sp. NPDC059255]|uniref:murein hydrolase activator EnvC family protein n=1 Tax=Streptomyces sp. NPDC059255 TaxID=3346793 RepID=UPI0036C610C1